MKKFWIKGFDFGIVSAPITPSKVNRVYNDSEIGLSSWLAPLLTATLPLSMTNSVYSGNGTKATVWGKLDPEGDYLISIDGLVMSTRFGKERLIKPADNGRGYLNFSYCKDGKKTTLNVHSCVAKVFLGDRSAEGLIVLHGKKGQSDNSLENISWGTQKQNCGVDKVRDGTSNRGERCGTSKLKEADIHKIRELRSTGMTYRKIADIFGVHNTLIGSILRGKTWVHL